MDLAALRIFKAVVEHGVKPDMKRLFNLAFGKRPAEELYDLSQNPWEIADVATKPRYAATKAKLRAELDRYLAETKDPRAAGKGGEFDHYDYVSSRIPAKPAETSPKIPARP